MAELGALAAVATVFVIILTILWIILPFYVISINEKMKTLLLIQRHTNEHIVELISATKNLTVAMRLKRPHNEALPPDDRHHLEDYES